MSAVVLDILRSEHQAISTVLRCLDQSVLEFQSNNRRPNFHLLHTIFGYLREFPNRCHHPKEDWHLFPLVEQRAPDLADVITLMSHQHIVGEQLLADLIWRLEDLEGHWTERPKEKSIETMAELVNTSRAYISFEREHARVESEKILAQSPKILHPEDWDALETVFLKNSDPVFGKQPKQRFAALLHTISVSGKLGGT